MKNRTCGSIAGGICALFVAPLVGQGDEAKMAGGAQRQASAGVGMPLGTELEPAFQPPATILPGQADASLAAVSEKWAVWCTSRLVEATRHFRGPSFDNAIYRQRLSEERAVLVQAGRNLGGLVTVTDDGTVVLADRRVSWYTVGGPVARAPQDRDISLIRSVYPDGILVQPSCGVRTPEAVTFIPFRGHDLDEKRSMEVVPAGDRSFRGEEIVRHNNVLAWWGPDALQFFDLESGKRRAVVVPAERGRTGFVTAFDGETVVSSYAAWAFDARTGAVLLGAPWTNRARIYSRASRIGQVFAVRNCIGYRIEDGWLVAIDFTSPTGRMAPLTKIVCTRSRYGDSEPIGQSPKGLILWTGRTWERLPWLKQLPATNQPQ